MRLTKEKLNRSGCASSPDPLSNTELLNACGDHKQCRLCELHLNTSTKFRSSVTNDTYNISSTNHGIGLACHTKNVVYLITCAKCSIQYVGMTTQSISKRIAAHRSKIITKKPTTGLYQHFLKPGHSITDFKVQIIYHYTKDDDNDAKDVLLHVEDFYMKKLATLMPFGLNDHVTDLNIDLSDYDFDQFHSANTPFFLFTHKRQNAVMDIENRLN